MFKELADQAKRPGDSVVASPFGYNEAQLRFHEGNAYTPRLVASRILFLFHRA
jgi:hypothetical protein